MNKPNVVILFILAALNARAQNLILNGSFESPSIPANTFSGTVPTSWTVGGPPPQIAAWVHNGNSGNASVWPPPEDGQQFADCGDDGQTLSQDFTITTQDTYTLTWFDSAGHSGGLTSSPYSALVWNGTILVSSNRFDAYHATFGAWMQRSTQFPLAPGTYTLQFRSEGAFNGLDTLIDNVSLVELPPNDLLASIHVSAVDICWRGRTNQMYQVQYQTTLSGTNWFDLGSPVLGTGTNCVTDSVTVEARFYRVVRVP